MKRLPPSAPHGPAAPRLVARAGRPRPAFTLLEMLATVVVMGIAAALLIPAMGETGILRVQGALRMVVSDMTFAQSDAVAFQERRALVFDVENNAYAIVAVPGNSIDVDNNVLYDPTKTDGRYLVTLNDPRFGGARMTSANFDNNNFIIFDALGGPVSDPGSNEPSSGGTIRLSGNNQSFRITVDAFTGRIRVVREAAGSGGGESEGGAGGGGAVALTPP
ncbi:MAG TPA: type II secretion system protein [Phycisphaerales bacterium]|jgi:prepilin-type N-terminal cleavage/methylation domain-containing protein|nr:type II secretion system protein [Phycisphaerales bacterium]